ncbi:hypothetical protein ACQY0O_006989 [Thecaphora frezii]
MEWWTLLAAAVRRRNRKVDSQSSADGGREWKKAEAGINVSVHRHSGERWTWYSLGHQEPLLSAIVPGIARPGEDALALVLQRSLCG